MRIAWLAASALLMASGAIAQDKNEAPDIPEHWELRDADVLSKSADVAIPYDAASLSLVAVQGETYDQNAQYRSEDDKIFGTIFLYRPSLPDIGLAFIATDAAITGRSGAALERLDDRLVDLGGLSARARRASYGQFADGDWHSVAAFVEAGSWVAKFRVSGPADRREEIEAAMDAMLADMKFGENSQPLPARKLFVEECAGALGSTKVEAAKARIEEAIVYGSIDGGVQEDEGEAPIGFNLLIGRVPSRLCIADRSVVNETVPVLTLKVLPNMLVQDNDEFGLDPRAFMLVGDAGSILEVTSFKDQPDRIFMIRNGIAMRRVYGVYSDVPSLEQIRDVAYNPDALDPIATIEPTETGTSIRVNCSVSEEGCDEVEVEVEE